MPMKDQVATLLGEKMAVIAARYQYRGILAVVDDDCIVLSHAVSVEDGGPSMGETARQEDPIGGSVILSLDAVEIVWQPQWCFAPLPGEEPTQAVKRAR